LGKENLLFIVEFAAVMLRYCMKRKTIYFIQEESSGAIKIGFTNDLSMRQSNLKCCNPNTLKLLATVHGSIADEMRLHEKFGHLRIKGEWYKPEPELTDFIAKAQSSGNVPLDLNKAVLEFKDAEVTTAGAECQKWIEIANNLPSTKDTDELMSIGSASRMLGISQQTLRTWEEQGRIKPHFTAKGHRRYTRKQIVDFRKQQMNQKELILPGITPAYLMDMVQQFVKGFDPLETINVSLVQDPVANRVKINIDSADGLTSISKTFNVKD